MQSSKAIQIVGLVIAIPLIVFALYNNLWAEPDPGIIPTIVVTTDPAYTELERELEIETLEGNMTKRGELDLLAACVEAEAGDQSMLGKRLVVDVVLNRIDSPNHPDSITGVINEPGQFSVVENGAIRSAVPSKDTWLAVFLELSGMRSDNEVIFFQTGGYSSYGRPWGHIGSHYFSTEASE